MAGAITSIPKYVARKFPHLLRPSIQWSHRAVQTVFRRFQSASATGDYPVGSPKTVYPGHPEYHHWEESAERQMRLQHIMPTLKYKYKQPATSIDSSQVKELGEKMDRLNYNMETIVQFLKDGKLGIPS